MAANRILAICVCLGLVTACRLADLANQSETFRLDGHRYVGALKDGNFHGRGRATLKDGTQLDGHWDDNYFIRGTVKRTDGIEYGFNGRLRYIFRDLAQTDIVGSGTAILPDGREYLGTVNQHGHFHGEGRMTFPAGKQQQGLWKDSAFVEAKPDHWQTTSFEAEGSEAARFNELRARIGDGTYASVTSVLVIKHGRVLVEEYFNGANRYTLHNVESVGKSFTSALVGIAVDQGLIASVDQTLVSYFPELDKGRGWDDLKDEITLKDVLTMSYGLAGNKTSSYYANVYNYGPDWIAEVLGHSLSFTPGTRFEYSSAASRLCAPIIAKASGMPVSEFAERYLFDPLGIDLYDYFVLPDGFPSLAGLDGIMSRDLAKLGQLYLNGGAWNGRQVLSESWVEASTSSHIRITPFSELTYGYYFWIKEHWQIGGRVLRTFFASGQGGSKIFVIPAEDMVVVITATAYQDRDAERQINRMVENELLPAVIPQ